MNDVLKIYKIQITLKIDSCFSYVYIHNSSLRKLLTKDSIIYPSDNFVYSLQCISFTSYSEFIKRCEKQCGITINNHLIKNKFESFDITTTDKKLYSLLKLIKK